MVAETVMAMGIMAREAAGDQAAPQGLLEDMGTGEAAMVDVVEVATGTEEVVDMAEGVLGTTEIKLKPRYPV